MKKNGYALLTLVFVVSAVALAVGLNLKLQSIAQTDSITAEIKAAGNFIAATGCAEDALRKLKNDPVNYRTDTIVDGTTTCTVSIADANPIFTVSVTATSDVFVKKLRSTVSLVKTEIAQTRWEELP